MITFESSGDFKRTDNFLKRMLRDEIFSSLDKYGREGVSALANATPIDSGISSKSWNYEVSRRRGTYSISWTNDHLVDGRPLVILLQYGHGTGTGGYVQGRDFINPVIRPIFDKIAESVWKEVTST